MHSLTVSTSTCVSSLGNGRLLMLGRTLGRRPRTGSETVDPARGLRAPAGGMSTVCECCCGFDPASEAVVLIAEHYALTPSHRERGVCMSAAADTTPSWRWRGFLKARGLTTRTPPPPAAHPGRPARREVIEPDHRRVRSPRVRDQRSLSKRLACGFMASACCSVTASARSIASPESTTPSARKSRTCRASACSCGPKARSCRSDSCTRRQATGCPAAPHKSCRTTATRRGSTQPA